MGSPIKKIDRIIERPARPGMVGDGFRVYNYIPGAGISQQRISPFLMLDFNAEFDFGPSEHVRGVDVHPHKGFETVTIAYQGSVAHHDSAGNSGIIRPGDVQWMTAGGGILHKEYHEQEFSRKGGPFEMVQLWVNLPKKDKLTPAHYQALGKDALGKVLLPDGKGEVNVIAGTFNGVRGPAQTYSPVHVYDIKLKKGGRIETSLPANYHTALLMIKGKAEVNGEPAAEHAFVLFADEGERIGLRADEDSVILLLSGEPIDEPIASYGPFVMNTQAEIMDSIREFQQGKFGQLD
ncbi:MAG: pirin family protein [Bacteroidota bacterium]|nr:pirin family protein [Bacteroidota bacterium]